MTRRLTNLLYCFSYLYFSYLFVFFYSFFLWTNDRISSRNDRLNRIHSNGPRASPSWNVNGQFSMSIRKCTPFSIYFCRHHTQPGSRADLGKRDHFDKPTSGFFPPFFFLFGSRGRGGYRGWSGRVVIDVVLSRCNEVVHVVNDEDVGNSAMKERDVTVPRAIVRKRSKVTASLPVGRSVGCSLPFHFSVPSSVPHTVHIDSILDLFSTDRPTDHPTHTQTRQPFPSRFPPTIYIDSNYSRLVKRERETPSCHMTDSCFCFSSDRQAIALEFD